MPPTRRRKYWRKPKRPSLEKAVLTALFVAPILLDDWAIVVAFGLAAIIAAFAAFPRL